MPGPETSRIADRAGAEALVARILATMAALGSVLQEEAAHIRTGHLRAGLALTDQKTALASSYLRGLEAAKANAVALARFHPEGVETLRHAHRAFTATVEANQAVLSTARTVSEGLIRTLADDIAKAQMPTGYGAAKAAPSPYGRATRSGPLVVSRSL